MLAVLVLCECLIRVRSNELPRSEKSLKDFASGIRFLVDPAPFSWPYGLLEKFPSHLKGPQRVPRMYEERRPKTQEMPRFYPPYWMSQMYSPDPNPTKMAAEKPIPLSLFYGKPYSRPKERFAENSKSPNVAMSSLMENKVPFLVEKQASPKFPIHLSAEQFMQLQEKYRMQAEHAVIEKPVPYPIEKRVPYPVEKPVPYPVEKPIPYPVEKLVPYPVPVPVRTPVEIPVPVPMVKFDPIFIPVRDPSAERYAALWMRQNLTSTTEVAFNDSNLQPSSQFEEVQAATTDGSFDFSSVSSHYEQPVNTSPVTVVQNQLLDSKADNQFAASDKSGDTTELTSTPTVSSSSSP